jgi:hypothetical protein
MGSSNGYPEEDPDVAAAREAMHEMYEDEERQRNELYEDTFEMVVEMMRNHKLSTH